VAIVAGVLPDHADVCNHPHPGHLLPRRSTILVIGPTSAPPIVGVGGRKLPPTPIRLTAGRTRDSSDGEQVVREPGRLRQRDQVAAGQHVGLEPEPVPQVLSPRGVVQSVTWRRRR